MNYNKYGEVINGKDTYKEVAIKLVSGECVGISWTDTLCTHLDIILKYRFTKYGLFQRGIKSNYLVVSIIDHTSYAFSMECIKESEYIKEKLRMDNECGDKLAELLNGIITYIYVNKMYID